MALGDLHNVSSPIAKATEVAPTYAEGTVEGLSQDLSGRLRVVADLDASDISIGAVEVKDAGSDQRLAVSAAGAAKVEGAGVAGTPAGGVASVQGVAGGTALPASQSGTWTVQPGNTANTTAWKVENGPYSLGRATADAQIKAGAGFIHTVSIAGLTATPTAGLVTIYDSLTETGTVVYAEWVFATVEGHTILLDVPVATGIYVGFDATLANAQVTVAYR